jgi:hypothetical protein
MFAVSRGRVMYSHCPHPCCTPFAPMNRCSWQWLGVLVVLRCCLSSMLSSPSVIVIVIPPTIHPMSSCLWGWGWVVCCHDMVMLAWGCFMMWQHCHGVVSCELLILKEFQPRTWKKQISWFTKKETNEKKAYYGPKQCNYVIWAWVMWHHWVCLWVCCWLSSSVVTSSLEPEKKKHN